jgi:threonine/homoserine/homoserine lactone efflux protein
LSSAHARSSRRVRRGFLIIVLVPGPSVLFVVGRSLSHGRRGGLMSVLGNELGALPLVAAVSLGVGAIVAQSIVLFTVVKMLGAAYLVYLGVLAIRHRRAGIDTDAPQIRQGVSSSTLLWQGVIVGLTNPKTIVFFVAVLPQFVNYHAGGIPLQMMVLGVLFTLVALICDSVWALAASAAGSWFARSPRRLAAVRATGGGMMIALGGSLALSGNKT